MSSELKNGVVSYSTPTHKKLLLTFDEAADYSGIGINTLRNACVDGKINFTFKVGRKTLIKREELERFISENNTI